MVQMEPWQVILALIQGLVEWLPISSEGQVVLFAYNFGNVPQEYLVTLAVWLHLGTALAVVARYPRDILQVLSLQDRRLFRLLLIATIGTAITAIPLYFTLKVVVTAFQGELLNVAVGVLLLVTALVLYIPTRQGEPVLDNEPGEPDQRNAFTSGLVQGFSVLPGLSRSGLTISALLLQKVDKEKALRFSFLMSVPAVLGILGVELLTGGLSVPVIPMVDLVLMELIVFVTGLLSMEALLRVAKSISFWKLCVLIGSIAIVFGLPAFF
ncbi:undecaprenyl-diphosphate phosphatase [Candidatus Thorarchaeota archaeon]|nr:MAG: undecaprenyl-diphosphate phosphatase [Candidatus Thorarchaeota archaeon]